MLAYRPLSSLPIAPPPGTAERFCRCGKSLADVEPNCLGAVTIKLAETLVALFVQVESCLPDVSAASLFWWTERLAIVAGKRPTCMQRIGERLGFYAEA